MAELIPLEYRIAVGGKSLIRGWIFVAVLAVAVAMGGLTYTYMWKRQQANAYVEMQRQYDKTTTLLQLAKKLQLSREILAAKMTASRACNMTRCCCNCCGTCPTAFRKTTA